MCLQSVCDSWPLRRNVPTRIDRLTLFVLKNSVCIGCAQICVTNRRVSTVRFLKSDLVRCTFNSSPMSHACWHAMSTSNREAAVEQAFLRRAGVTRPPRTASDGVSATGPTVTLLSERSDGGFQFDLTYLWKHDAAGGAAIVIIGLRYLKSSVPAANGRYTRYETSAKQAHGRPIRAANGIDGEGFGVQVVVEANDKASH